MVQDWMGRVWDLRWDNLRKEKALLLVHDGLPTAQRVHLVKTNPGIACACGSPNPGRAHCFWECPVARAVVEAGEHQLVVLDELTYLMNWGWIDADEVIRVLRDRPPTVNVIVTGRDASQELQDIADTVTEMREVKHAYNAGIRAKRGIDY